MKYKDFIFTSTSYSCDKNCPYCISKIGQLEKQSDDIEALKKVISDFKNNGDTFEYFVFSGNGEPSLYSYDFLLKIKQIAEESKIFADLRIQTSGNLFFDKSKLQLFSKWLVEITRVNECFDADSSILNYKRNYLKSNNFQDTRIRLNHVLLKNNIDTLTEDIKNYFNKYRNIETIAVKILDTYNKNLDCKESLWVKEHGLSYSNKDLILNILNNEFQYIGYSYNNYLWSYDNKLISMYYKTEKIKNNIMFYGNKIL